MWRYANYYVLGDRVQWFHTKADMERWHEACEKIQAELRNCIWVFGRMEEVWVERAELSAAPAGSNDTAWSVGHTAYAHRQAETYAKLRDDCKKAYLRCCFKPIPEDPLFPTKGMKGKQMEEEEEKVCPIFADTVAETRTEVQNQDDVAVAEQLAKVEKMTAALTCMKPFVPFNGVYHFIYPSI